MTVSANSRSFMGVHQCNRSDDTEAAPPSPAKGQTEQSLAAAPFGAWQVLPPFELVDLADHVWPFWRRQKPMLTHGSSCQRAWSGPLKALVTLSGSSEEAASARCRRSPLGMLLDARRGVQQEPGWFAVWPGRAGGAYSGTGRVPTLSAGPSAYPAPRAVYGAGSGARGETGVHGLNGADGGRLPFV